MIVKQLLVFSLIMYASNYILVDHFMLEGDYLMFCSIVAFILAGFASGINSVQVVYDEKE